MREYVKELETLLLHNGIDLPAMREDVRDIAVEPFALTHEHLRKNFAAARENNAKFVFVTVVAEGVEEIITIPEKSFDAKEAFYLRSYSEKGLIHTMNSNVYIRGLSYGEADELNMFT